MEIEIGKQRAGIAEFFNIVTYHNTYLECIESEQEHHKGLQAMYPD